MSREKIDVNIYGEDDSNRVGTEELNTYITHIEKKEGRSPISIDVELDGEYVNLTYSFEPRPLERVRRLLGYHAVTAEPRDQANVASQAMQEEMGAAFDEPLPIVHGDCGATTAAEARAVLGYSLDDPDEIKAAISRLHEVARGLGLDDERPQSEPE